MNPSHRGGRHYKVPGGFEDPSGPQLLPELDIEFTAWSLAAGEPGHNQAFGHYCHYPLSRPAQAV